MNLKRLLPSARLRLPPEFYSDGSTPELEEFIKPFGRELSIEACRQVVEHLMDARGPSLAAETDAWLAPRLHAALRLTRREAADRDIWSFLAVVVFPDYVRARWGSEPGRYFASEVNQAISRLWWGAELCRNGGDYGPVLSAFAVQDVPNTWFRLDAFHNRPLAVGLARLIAEDSPTGRQLNSLATATNVSLTTVALDAFASVSATNDEATAEWLALTPSVDDLLRDELPSGPADERVDEATVTAAAAYLRGLMPGSAE